MDNQMTIEQVLKATADMLGNVNVPAGLIRTIGEPIAAAIENLTACLNAIEADRAAKAEEAKEESEDGEREENYDPYDSTLSGGGLLFSVIYERIIILRKG